MKLASADDPVGQRSAFMGAPSLGREQAAVAGPEHRNEYIAYAKLPPLSHRNLVDRTQIVGL